MNRNKKTQNVDIDLKQYIYGASWGRVGGVVVSIEFLNLIYCANSLT